MAQAAAREERPAVEDVKVLHPLDAIHDTALYIIRITQNPMVEEAARAIVSITRHEVDVRASPLCRRIRQTLDPAST